MKEWVFAITKIWNVKGKYIKFGKHTTKFGTHLWFTNFRFTDDTSVDPVMRSSQPLSLKIVGTGVCRDQDLDYWGDR